MVPPPAPHMPRGRRAAARAWARAGPAAAAAARGVVIIGGQTAGVRPIQYLGTRDP